MIGKGIAWIVSSARDALGKGLVAMRIKPDFITVMGTILTIAAGACFAVSIKTDEKIWCIYAGVLLFFSIACDMLDGVVARLTNHSTTFGAFLDSTMDRVSDFAIWAGMAFGYAWKDQANITFIMLSFLGFFEASMISYIKARSEDFIESCKVGYWQRGERCAAMIISAFACNPAAFVVEQSILPLFTLLRRALHAKTCLAGGTPVTNARIEGKWYHKIQPWLYPRMSWPYDIMTAGYIAFLIFARFNPANYDFIRFWLD